MKSPSDILKRFDPEEVLSLRVSGRIGSDKAEGIYLNPLIYERHTMKESQAEMIETMWNEVLSEKNDPDSLKKKQFDKLGEAMKTMVESCDKSQLFDVYETMIAAGLEAIKKKTNPMVLFHAVVTVTQDQYGIHFPQFPGCVSVGDTIYEVLGAGQEALQFHIDGMLEDEEVIPTPTEVFPPEYQIMVNIKGSKPSIHWD